MTDEEREEFNEFLSIDYMSGEETDIESSVGNKVLKKVPSTKERPHQVKQKFYEADENGSKRPRLTRKPSRDEKKEGSREQ